MKMIRMICSILFAIYFLYANNFIYSQGTSSLPEGQISGLKNNPDEISSITWSSLSSGLNGIVYTIAVSGSDVYVGGSFTTAGGSPASNIAKWNGSSWSALGDGITGTVYALAISGTDLYVGGNFSSAGGTSVNNIARWDGSSWYSVGDGFDAPVQSIAVSLTKVYAGGQFTHSGSTSINRIAQWNGSSWSALGSGVDDIVMAVHVSGSDVYAGGYFYNAGGNPAKLIAKWDGSNWSALGSGLGNGYSDVVICITSDGSTVFAGGTYSDNKFISSWDGSNWTSLPSSGIGLNNWVYSLVIYNGTLYAGGNFTLSAGSTVNHVAKWNGTSWTALGNGTDDQVRALAVSTAEGRMLVGGGFTNVDGSISANHIAGFTDSENPFPVELNTFTAVIENGKVNLKWRTESEINNYGFDVECSTDKVNWEAKGFVKGHGNSNKRQDYSFLDAVPTESIQCIWYRLKQIDNDGQFNYSEAVEVSLNSPVEFELYQNYPNPFNPSTKIKFSLPSPLQGEEPGVRLVILKVYDILGNEIATLVNEQKAPGNYEVQWNASGFASGVYFCRLQSEAFISVKKLLLMK